MFTYMNLNYDIGDLIKVKNLGKLVIIKACPSDDADKPENNYYYAKNLITKKVYKFVPYHNEHEQVSMEIVVRDRKSND